MVKPDDLACYEKLAEHSKEEIYKNKYLSMLARTARYADAVVFAAKSLILSPQRSAEFWDNYGFSLLKLGRYQEALDCAEKFLGIRQNDYKMSWRQVLLLIKLEKYEAAISVLEKLPKRDEVVMSMLFLLSRLGKFDKALALSNMFFDEKTPNLKALFHSLAGDLETAIQLQGKS
jgi:tetratricopeptide (TPR) repeat protein